MSEPLMEAVLGTNSRIEVSIAWGADLTDIDGSGWSWTDITNKVFVSSGVSITVGRSDEASTTQPAKCSFTVDNSDAGFSLGGLSPNYPNVRRNTPVRVRVDPDGSGFTQVFQGYADQFNPSWDISGNVATVKISASGVLRRLAQNSKPLISPMRRQVLTSESLVAYWPCEDGDNAGDIGSGMPQNGSRMHFFGSTPDFASDSNTFTASLPILKLNNAGMGGEVNGHEYTGEYQVRFLISVPSGGTDDEKPICTLFGTGSVKIWDLIYSGGSGTLRMRAFDGGNTEVLNQDMGFGINGDPGQLGIQLSQNGSNIDWQVDHVGNDDGVSGGLNFTLNSHTIGIIHGVLMNSELAHQDVAIGHITVQTALTSELELSDSVLGYNGEATWGGGRLDRLCEENLIDVDIDGLSNGDASSDITDSMGPQNVSAIVPLLREVEVTDQGILHDGTTPGLRLAARRFIENQEVTFTVHASDLVEPSGPVYDDQGIRNKINVTQKGGSSAQAEDIDGPLGTETIGIYESGHTISMQYSEAALQYAHWILHKGTFDGYRYPQLAFDVAGAADPQALALKLVDMLPGSRIDVVGFDQVFSQHPAGVVRLLVQGYTHTFTSTSWKTTVNVSQFDANRIVQLADDTGDTDEFLLHLDTDDSEIGYFEVSDDFNRSNASSLGSNWVDRNGGMAINTNTAIPETAVLTTASHVTLMTSDDMEVSVTLGANVGTGDRIGVILGSNIAGQGVWGLWDPAASLVRIYTVDLWSSFGAVERDTASASFTTADVLTLRRVGNVYTMLKNGAAISGSEWTDSGDVVPRNSSHRLVGLAIDASPSLSNYRRADAFGAKSNVGVGATSISLITNSGPIWTTTADDFPFNVEIEGIAVTVTNITGSSSPQTATVTGVTKELTAGSAVTVWNPPVLGL